MALSWLLLAGAVPASSSDTCDFGAHMEKIILETFLRHFQFELLQTRRPQIDGTSARRREGGRPYQKARHVRDVGTSAQSLPDLVADLRERGAAGSDPATDLRLQSRAPMTRTAADHRRGQVQQSARALRLVAERVHASHIMRTKRSPSAETNNSLPPDSAHRRGLIDNVSINDSPNNDSPNNDSLVIDNPANDSPANDNTTEDSPASDSNGPANNSSLANNICLVNNNYPVSSPPNNTNPTGRDSGNIPGDTNQVSGSDDEGTQNQSDGGNAEGNNAGGWPSRVGIFCVISGIVLLVRCFN